MKDFVYILPIFVGMFFFTIYLLSRKGWSDLANNYQFEGDFQGTRFGIISASINGVNYNNCLLLKYNEQGFYLRPVFVFRLFHKTIFIPWQEIKDVRDKKIVFVQLKEIVIGEPAVAIMQMKSSTFAKIEQVTLLNSFSNSASRKNRFEN